LIRVQAAEPVAAAAVARPVGSRARIGRTGSYVSCGHLRAPLTVGGHLTAAARRHPTSAAVQCRRLL
jgi:hypothetical protein